MFLTIKVPRKFWRWEHPKNSGLWVSKSEIKFPLSLKSNDAALPRVDTIMRIAILRELDGCVINCLEDQNGNHVVQNCVESVPAEHLQLILDFFIDYVHSISTKSDGCGVT